MATTLKPGVTTAPAPAAGGAAVSGDAAAGATTEADVESTTSGAAMLDDSSLYFVRLIVVVVWMVYLFPIFAKFIGRKQSKLQKKLKSGWEILKGEKSVTEMTH